jgi:sulfatase modifying factor 1
VSWTSRRRGRFGALAIFAVSCADANGKRREPNGDAASVEATDAGTDDAVSLSSGDAEVAVDSGAPPPSCAPGGPGMTNCGADGESCCTSLEVKGGTYYRTYDFAADGGATLAVDGGPTGLADPAGISSFRLDKYLVTVGRFRQFVRAWNRGIGLDGGAGYEPPEGAGKHTYLNGGNGLSDTGGRYETGWSEADDSNIALTDANLACGSGWTWTASPGGQENLPINCVNWYEAYAFCIWDGGFLPSEAEWEYAPGGGEQQREYPWGSSSPGTNNQYAIYDCYYPSGSGGCPDTTMLVNIAPVGTATLGAGLWGELDLAGELDEWTLDYFATYWDPCADCVNLTQPAPPARPQRAIRGGGFFVTTSGYMRVPYRASNPPAFIDNEVGFRCARAP